MSVSISKRYSLIENADMVIVSAGMQKSGSAYIYNIINDLNISIGHPDARVVKEQHGLENIMQWHNNNVGSLDKELLKRLVDISKTAGPFVIKTHGGPTAYLDRLNFFGKAKTIYIYRDPRDVIISAMDHGKKIIAAGESHTFAGMVSFDDAFQHVKLWVEIWREYNARKRVLKIRYEDMMSNPKKEVERILKHLGITVSAETVEQILFKYDKNNKEANMKGLHFNKGVTERYRDELTADQIKRFSNELGNELRLMGYSL